MTRDEQEQTALMGGSAFQETGMMDDYLTRVAEAVRDAVLNETVDMASTRGFLIECIFDLPKIIASVPRPEPVAAWAAGTAAIEFALEDATGEGMAFLRCWLYGDFDVIRNEWPEAPESVYIGADPLHPETVAMLAAAPEAPPVAAQPAVPDGLLTAADMKHLRRFSECAEDCDGHDVPKEDMKRLERLGAVRSLGFGRHETTAFGDAMLGDTPEAPQTAAQWWLAELDQYGNPTLIDGAHGQRAGADQAFYLHSALGLAGSRKYAVARVELSEPVANGSNVNHDAVGTLRMAIQHNATLREQNAALVAAVEATLFHVNNNTATINSSVVCELYDALAIAEGGAA